MGSSTSKTHDVLIYPAWRSSNPLYKPSHTCAICLEDICDNFFWCSRCTNPIHKKCIEKWKKFGKTCPLCRLPLNRA